MVFTKFKSTDAGKARYTDDYLGFENSTYYRHTAMIKKKVYVEKEGWYNVDLVICNVDYQQNPSKLTYLDVVTVPRVQPMSQSPHHQLLLQSPEVHSDAMIETTAVESYLARIDGNVKFKNPYGDLPAEFYGLLPFEVSRLINSFVLASSDSPFPHFPLNRLQDYSRTFSLLLGISIFIIKIE